jgi:hypothetical protein
VCYTYCLAGAGISRTTVIEESQGNTHALGSVETLVPLAR